MKVKRLKDSFTSLEQSQMEEIDRLQEQIKLFQFDRTKDRQEITKLKNTLIRKKHSLISVIQELELMMKEDNYDRLRVMINVLKTIVRDNDE